MTSTEDLKNADFTPALIAKETKPKKTWFIKRGDGKVFSCEANEAWGLFENRSNWRRRDFRIIGVSDGKKFQEVIRSSKNKGVELKAELDRLERDLGRYRKTEERMVFDDLIDPDGDEPEFAADRAKIKRVREIIAQYELKVEEAEKAYKNVVGNVFLTAFNAEMEVAIANQKAKGFVEYPDNQYIITPNASPKQRKKVLKAMSQDEEGENE